MQFYSCSYWAGCVVTSKQIQNITIIFEPLEEVHFYKDVGMVPYHLARYLDAKVTFVCLATSRLTIPFKNQDITIKYESSIDAYLHTHAYQIDILMMFHFATRNIRYGTLYKKLNPSGFLYIKYDCEEQRIPYLYEKPWYSPSRYKRRFLYSRFQYLVDLLSVECIQVYSLMTDLDKNKLHYLPNGIFSTTSTSQPIDIKVYGKENIILIVGRHGSHQKNTEMIFDLIPRLQLSNGWKFVLLGSVTPSFNELYRKFLEKYPHCINRIELIGNVSDREVVLSFYKRAKVLLLPSRSEGFPIVGSEALSQGVVVCMSKELTSSIDITNDGKVGFRIPRTQLDAWVEVLNTLITDDKLRIKLAKASHLHFVNSLAWDKTIPPLAQRIFNEINQRNHQLQDKLL